MAGKKIKTEVPTDATAPDDGRGGSLTDPVRPPTPPVPVLPEAPPPDENAVAEARGKNVEKIVSAMEGEMAATAKEFRDLRDQLSEDIDEIESENAASVNDPTAKPMTTADQQYRKGRLAAYRDCLARLRHAGHGSVTDALVSASDYEAQLKADIGPMNYKALPKPPDYLSEAESKYKERHAGESWTNPNAGETADTDAKPKAKKKKKGTATK